MELLMFTRKGSYTPENVAMCWTVNLDETVKLLEDFGKVVYRYKFKDNSDGIDKWVEIGGHDCITT